MSYSRWGEIMKCIILAAGYATRLYPLTENFPKPLLEVNNKTILDYLIEDINTSGLIDEYIVISNHKFIDIFKEWASNHEVKITVVDDGTTSNETRLGAVKDIKYAIDTLHIEDDCLIIAGDNLLDFSLNEFINYAKDKNTSCIMRYELNDLTKLQRTGVLVLDSNDKVLEMQEKPQVPKSNYACPPFYFYKKEDLSRIDEALEDGCGYDAPGSLVAWLCKRVDIYAYNMPGNRYDIGNLESYEEIKRTYKGVNYESKSRFKK